MIDVKKILIEICEDERAGDPNVDLIDSGLLDSYAFIEFFAKLSDMGIEIQPTRIDRDVLRNVSKLSEYINNFKN
jgi:acyl carrier protein